MSEWLSGDYRKDNDKTYLGHWDLDPDNDTIATIAGVKLEEVKSARGSQIKQVLYFVEKDIKPLILNKKVNPTSITKATGSPLREKWIGKKIALYVGNEPKADEGLAVRIRDYAPKVDEYYCEDCGQLITGHEVNGKLYSNKVIANRALTKYGRCLCFDCAQKQEAGNGAE